MNLIRKTRMLAPHIRYLLPTRWRAMLAHQVLDRLSIRWQARIKDWFGLDVGPVEQLALIDAVDGFPRMYQTVPI